MNVLETVPHSKSPATTCPHYACRNPRRVIPVQAEPAGRLAIKPLRDGEARSDVKLDERWTTDQGAGPMMLPSGNLQCAAGRSFASGTLGAAPGRRRSY